VGYCLLVGIFYARLRERARYEKMAVTLFCILILFYSMRTFLRNFDWRSGATLWEAEMRQNPRNADRFGALGAEYAMARSDHLVKGNVYREKGDFQKSAFYLELARDYEDRALRMLEQGIKEQPRDVMNLYNYGILCVEMREPDLERAEKFLLQGASYAAESPQTLSFLYYCIAVIDMKFNPPRADHALEFLGHAEHLRPNDSMVLVEKAATLGKMGRYRESLAVVLHTLSRHPSSTAAVRMLKFLREGLSGGKMNER
jgi:tetratricopeptide (TPR) repeat protein